MNFIDIRPLSETIEGLKFTQADATDLKGIDDGVIESMSCLHALEHFGLGRYGDIVDPKGYIKVAQSIQRVIRPGGVLYLSLPIGNEDKIVFNAHRIFSPSTIIGLFDCMDLEELTVVDPVGCGMNKIDKRSISSWNYKDYSCGIFIFQKKLSS